MELAQLPQQGASKAWTPACSRAARSRNWPLMQQIATAWTRAEPESVQAWQSLSHACFEQKLFTESLDAFDVVLSLDPENFRQHVSAARIATAAERFERAQRHLTTADRLQPGASEVLLASCRLNYLNGNLQQAEHDCRQALAASPTLVPAYITLGQLCQGRLRREEVAAIQRLLAQTWLHPEYRAALLFTLGEALDHAGEYGAAFSAWQHANRVNMQLSQQEGLAYQRAEQEQELEILISLFPPGSASSVSYKKAAGTQSPQPIFVLGMPRSGTTLVESILASHSTVHGGGELPMLPEIHDELITMARRIGIEETRSVMQRKLARWREAYLAALPTPAGSDAVKKTGWVVDKQPLNFRSIGLIRLLFPDSPIIATERDALEIGLSIYRHDFSKNWPCAHRLEDIGHYLGLHRRLMAHWYALAPNHIHRLEHADMIKDSSAEIRSLLAFAGLTEEPACYEPHKTQRAVSTFSAVQVRQPVSAAFSGRATHYVSYLEPLKKNLSA